MGNETQAQLDAITQQESVLMAGIKAQQELQQKQQLEAQLIQQAPQQNRLQAGLLGGLQGLFAHIAGGPQAVAQVNQQISQAQQADAQRRQQITMANQNQLSLERLNKMKRELTLAELSNQASAITADAAVQRAGISADAANQEANRKASAANARSTVDPMLKLRNDNESDWESVNGDFFTNAIGALERNMAISPRLGPDGKQIGWDETPIQNEDQADQVINELQRRLRYAKPRVTDSFYSTYYQDLNDALTRRNSILDSIERNKATQVEAPVKPSRAGTAEEPGMNFQMQALQDVLGFFRDIPSGLDDLFDPGGKLGPPGDEAGSANPQLKPQLTPQLKAIQARRGAGPLDSELFEQLNKVQAAKDQVLK